MMKLLTLIVTLLFFLPIQSLSSNLHVPDDYPTIQEAIDVAVDGDNVLVAPGTYHENIDFLGKAILVNATGNVEATIIDGGQNGLSVATFTNKEGTDSVLHGFTITNGKAENGGGIHCVNSSPTLESNVISLNHADNGGGIYCHWYSYPVIKDSVISGNEADKYGAGIYCFKSSSTISNNQIVGNVAYERAAGIYCFESSPDIIDNEIIGNEMTHGSGGGIFCSTHSSPRVSGNDISDNYSFYEGGGIYCELKSTPTIEHNTIFDNRARYGGGGIYCNASSPIIQHNTISDNYSYQSIGGGIYCGSDSSPIIANNTISYNRAWNKSGGGIFSAGSPTITINTISYNMAVEGGGIHCRWASPVITNNSIFENESENDGAGIRCWGCDYGSRIEGNRIYNNRSTSGSGGGIQSYDSLTAIVDNTISWNESVNGGGIYYFHSDDPLLAGNVISFNQAKGGRGGGIYSIWSDPSVSSNVIESNTAVQGGGVFCEHSDPMMASNNCFKNAADIGGGLFCEDSYPRLINTTFFKNTATSMGGCVYCWEHGIVRLWNCILWENDAPEGKEIWVGDSTLSISHCDVEQGQDAVHVDPQGVLEWGEGMIDENPLFSEAADNDFHLRFTSPCRDAGDNLYVMELFDFEGDPRIAYGTVDMGADEFYTHLYVMGDKTPGGSIVGKLVGLPGTSPVGLFIGSGIADPPIQSAWGPFYLQAPWWLAPLIPIPSEGILVLTAAVPLSVPAPIDLPMQALIGLNPDSLTNLEVLEVR
jgi:parallel beta-helix repeat protein